MKTKNDTPATLPSVGSTDPEASNPQPATADEQPLRAVGSTEPEAAFDQGTAVWQEPAYRHAPTARTVAWHQPLPGGRTALFSATGQLIAIDEGSNPPAPLNP